MALINFKNNIKSNYPKNISFAHTIIKNEDDHNIRSNISDVNDSSGNNTPVSKDTHNNNNNNINLASDNFKVSSTHEILSFNYIKSTSYPISGTIWFDFNNNKDNYDILLENIQIDLYKANNLLTPILTTTTNQNGHFEFNNINLNYYYIKINLLNDDYVPIDKDNYSLINSKILLSNVIYNNKENTHISIGLSKTFTICGVIFFDKYATSVYDVISNGINHVSLNLYDEDDNIISSTTTSKFSFLHGYYEFNNLLPGKYKITIDIPKYVKITKPLVKNYYGSKAYPESNGIIVDISDESMQNAFIGVTLSNSNQ